MSGKGSKKASKDGKDLKTSKNKEVKKKASKGLTDHKKTSH